MARRFQFSLRALFVLVTVVGVWLGVQVNSARRQAAIVSAIRQLDGFVYYDWQFDEDDQETGATDPPGPAWLRKLIGDDYFQTVIAVYLINHPYLEEDRLLAVDQLPALKRLALGETQVGDATMPRISKLKHLRFLDISQTNVTDAGIVYLERLRGLKWLFVGTWDRKQTVSEAGLKRVAPAFDLERLQVVGHGFTDASIPVFVRFKNLRELGFLHTRVTEEGQERLKKRLPNCEIWSGEP